ncbi:hypothetical protein Micbo1qcDRAFT_237247 [Microdochium bolleyi]|uniref:Rhodopsin domain-containing protein n=1 Tax=Microdochium bolleyi TaxID=196109 RepID=A0A136ILK4_9PEZI|nr:hypothetical protein Micbo1qcDRAFT_237247 [Microdochium bolleyi]
MSAGNSTAGPPFIVDGVVVLALAPPGYVVNFADPPQRFATEHYVVFATMGTLATVALAQRLYTKMVLSKGLGVDDGFMVAAWLMSMTTQALLTHSFHIGGLGVHIFEMPLTRFVYAMTLAYAAGGIFMMCGGLAKLSLLAFYLQLSPERWFRVAVWTSIGIVSTLTFVITTLLFYHCTPARASWDVLTTGTCVDVGVLYMATAVQNIATDVLIFLLPIPMVLGLQMGRRQKIGALVIFGVGSITIMTSAIRLALLPALLKQTDVTYEAAPPNIWSFVEANLFIICGSMPTLRKFFKHFAPKLVGSYGYGTSAPYGHSGGGGAYSRKSHGYGKKSQLSRPGEYNRFGGGRDKQDTDDDVELGVMGDKSRRVTADIVAVQPGRKDAGADDGSDKAILTTRTVVVEYGSRN